MVQAWVAQRLVALLQIGVNDLAGPSQTLGDVVAGQLDVDTARDRAQRAMHLEEAANLIDDIIEPARLVARW